MDSDFATLSNTKARSSACGDLHFPPSTGVCQSSSYNQTGAAFCVALRSACTQACCRTRRALVMAKNKSDGDASGSDFRYPAITQSISLAGIHAARLLRNPASSNENTEG